MVMCVSVQSSVSPSIFFGLNVLDIIDDGIDQLKCVGGGVGNKTHIRES